MEQHGPLRWTDLRSLRVGTAIVCALALALALAPRPATAAAAAPSEEPEDLHYEMPMMMFFIASDTSDQPVRLTIGLTLELDDAAAGAEVEQSMPLITDGILRLFAYKTSSQLNGEEAMERLRAEILAVVADAVGLGRVRDVLFREMLTRRAR